MYPKVILVDNSLWLIYIVQKHVRWIFTKICGHFFGTNYIGSIKNIEKIKRSIVVCVSVCVCVVSKCIATKLKLTSNCMVKCSKYPIITSILTASLMGTHSQYILWANHRTINSTRKKIPTMIKFNAIFHVEIINSFNSLLHN